MNIGTTDTGQKSSDNLDINGVTKKEFVTERLFLKSDSCRSTHGHQACQQSHQISHYTGEMGHLIKNIDCTSTNPIMLINEAVFQQHLAPVLLLNCESR